MAKKPISTFFHDGERVSAKVGARWRRAKIMHSVDYYRSYRISVKGGQCIVRANDVRRWVKGQTSWGING